MLRWIATRTYNRFDPIWIGLCALAICDSEWFAVIVFAVVGALLSAVIEMMADRNSS